MSQFGQAMIGRAVFHYGVRSLENTVSAQSEENSASQGGDVKEYQKAQDKEFSGFAGSLRHAAMNHPGLSDAMARLKIGPIRTSMTFAGKVPL